MKQNKKYMAIVIFTFTLLLLNVFIFSVFAEQGVQHYYSEGFKLGDVLNNSWETQQESNVSEVGLLNKSLRVEKTGLSSTLNVAAERSFGGNISGSSVQFEMDFYVTGDNPDAEFQITASESYGAVWLKISEGKLKLLNYLGSTYDIFGDIMPNKVYTLKIQSSHPEDASNITNYYVYSGGILEYSKTNAEVTAPRVWTGIRLRALSTNTSINIKRFSLCANDMRWLNILDVFKENQVPNNYTVTDNGLGSVYMADDDEELTGNTGLAITKVSETNSNGTVSAKKSIAPTTSPYVKYCADIAWQVKQTDNPSNLYDYFNVVLADSNNQNVVYLTLRDYNIQPRLNEYSSLYGTLATVYTSVIPTRLEIYLNFANNTFDVYLGGNRIMSNQSFCGGYDASNIAYINYTMQPSACGSVYISHQSVNELSVFPTAGSVTTVYNVQNESGNGATNLKNIEKIQAIVNNQTDSPISADVHAACYSGGILDDIAKMGSVYISPNSTEAYDGVLPFDVSATANKRVKIFAWDNFNNIMPFGDMLDVSEDNLFISGKMLDSLDTIAETGVLNEDFEEDIADSFPSNWDSNAPDDVVVTENQDGGKYLYINSATPPLFVKRSSDSPNYGISRFFSPVSGNLTLEFDFKTGEMTGRKILPSLSSDKSAENNTRQKIMELSLEGGILYAIDQASSISLESLQAQQWYHFRIDIDTGTQSYDVYLDNVMLASDLKFIQHVARLGRIKLYIDKDSSGTMYLDNVKLYAGERLLFKNGGTVTSIPDNTVSINFDNFKTGEKPSNITYSGASTIVIQEYTNGSGKYLYYEKPAVTGANEYVPVSLGKTFSGNVEITFKVCATDVTSSYKSIYFGDLQIPIQFTGTNIMTGGSSAYNSLTKDNWYDIKIVTNTANQLYDFYVNGALRLTNIPYSTAGTSINKLYFVMDKSQIGSIAIDNIVVTQTGSVDLVIDGYDKNRVSGAGEKSDYVNQFLPELDGLIVEAEDMKLANYAVVQSNSAHNGKAIEVSGPGIGTAEYVFTGNDGYYAIRVGYYEKVIKSEAISKVYVNGKEIDYWFSQNDDNLLHVRDVKSDYYLNNGDVITVEGFYGYNPSPIDFLQITAPVNPNFTRGHLAYEMYASWTSFNAPGWEFSEAGGSVRKWGYEYQGYSLNFVDVNENESIWGRRRFQKQESGILTTDIVMIFEKKTDGIKYELKNGDNSVITVVTDNGDICYVNWNGQKVVLLSNYPINTRLTLRIEANIDTQTAKIRVSGGYLAFDVVFLNNQGAIDNLYVETSVEDTAHFAFLMLDISAGYLLNEDFMVYRAYNNQLSNWSLTGSNTQISEMNSNPNNLDSASLTLKTSGSAKREFAEQTGIITSEYEFMIDNVSDETTVTLGNDSGIAVKLKSFGGNLCYVKADDTTELLWSNFKNHMWYHIGIVADVNTKTVTIEVNNVEKAADVPFYQQISSIKNIQFVTNGSDLFWIDDIIVFEGAYESNVPEPTPIDTGDVTVGVQTCDLWNEGEHFGWNCVRPYDDRTPYLGYYTDSDPEAADWETKWMVEHGITLRQACFFRPSASNLGYPIKRPSNSAYLHEGYFNSKYKDMMKFTIMFENSNFASNENDFLQNVVRYWIERYFKNPQYYKYNNMPVVSIYRHDLMSGLLGSAANVKATLDAIRDMVVAEGFDGIIINTVLYQVGNSYGESEINSMGFDYTYQYSFGAASIEEQVAKASQQQQNGIIDGIGVLTQGWGCEPWGYSDRKTNNPLNDWNNGLTWLKDYYMPGYNDDSLASHLILLDNWNEIAEGHFIAPSNICGFGYLDEIRRVFGTGIFAHADTIPSQIGLGPYDYRAENILR